jgi:transposase
LNEIKNLKKSSKPQSPDLNRKKKHKPKKAEIKVGKKGHIGTTLKKVDDPDVIEPIKVERRTLPAG